MEEKEREKKDLHEGYKIRAACDGLQFPRRVEMCLYALVLISCVERPPIAGEISLLLNLFEGG